jgi:hypothetical protein
MKTNPTPASVIGQSASIFLLTNRDSFSGTVPKQEQLVSLPGLVTIFFDRNDEPRQDGTIPSDAGAKKLALALGERGRIAQVPMPSPCDVTGWDVSNALGFF